MSGAAPSEPEARRATKNRYDTPAAGSKSEGVGHATLGDPCPVNLRKESTQGRDAYAGGYRMQQRLRFLPMFAWFAQT